MRNSCGPLPAELVAGVPGRLAENLRRLAGYRQCRQIFADPSLLLRQVRINALLDGKELIMPAAGLKEGFYLLEPFSIPFKELPIGVTYKGLPRYGRKIFVEDIPALGIALMIGESWAVDEQGGRLGDGQGYFDLAAALLAELGGLADNCQIVAAIDDPGRMVTGVPVEKWDVRCNAVVSPADCVTLSGSPVIPDIVWQALQMERIKRISPLWRLYGRK